MIWLTHLAFGLVMFLVFRNWMGGELAIALAICMIGALLPDIDHHKSKVGRKLPVISHIISWVFNHRGLVHSVIGMVVFTAVALLATNALGGNSIYALWFLTGYASHLIVDSLNPSGVAWLAPFTSKRARGSIRTSSFSEGLFLVVLLVVVGVVYVL